MKLLKQLLLILGCVVALAIIATLLDRAGFTFANDESNNVIEEINSSQLLQSDDHVITITAGSEESTVPRYEEYNVDDNGSNQTVGPIVVRRKDIPQARPQPTAVHANVSTRASNVRTEEESLSLSPTNEEGMTREEFLTYHSTWALYWEGRPLDENKERIVEEFFDLAWANNKLYDWAVFNRVRYSINPPPQADLAGVPNPKYTDGSDGELPYVDGTSFRQVGVTKEEVPLYRRNKGPSLKDQVEAAQAAHAPRHGSSGRRNRN